MIRILKRVFWVGVALTLVTGMAFFFLFVEGTSRVPYRGVPSSEDVAAARQFVRDVRSSVDTDSPDQAPVTLTQAQLNSVIKLAARLIPGFRGRVLVNDSYVLGEASVPIPLTGESMWLNASVIAPEFEGAFKIIRATLGPRDLPPDLAQELGRIGANILFGNRFGDAVLTSASAMQTEDDEVHVTLAIDELGKNGLMRGFFGTMRGTELPDSREVDRYYRLIRQAMDRGDLPTQGSYLPYILFTLQEALWRSANEGAENAYTSALLALARVCGARDFLLIVGGLAGDDTGDHERWRTNCDELTFNGRIDSRRHFTTSAAIQASSNRGFSVAMGEYKELFDARNSGGFDFTDLAANNSGIRMSNRFMSVSARNWPLLIAAIREENDVLVPFTGIPTIMSEEEFKGRFKTIDSPEYFEMFEKIEARIDQLALHAVELN